jgi:tetratricopeptide (TPR) repeat protein
MKRYSILLACLLTLGLAGCASVPVVVPEGLTAPEIIQRAQEASDQDKYDDALIYYNAALTRFPDDIEVVCSCEYEIAFIYFKQEKYDASRELFTTLLARYDQPDAKLLPAQYKILGEKILAKVNLEIETRNKKEAAQKAKGTVTTDAKQESAPTTETKQ